VAELWNIAAARVAEFDARAVAYDQFRPRYPTETFDAIVGSIEKTAVKTAVDVGCGTGIGALPLLDRGIDVLGIEPSPQMAAIAEAKFAGRGGCVVSRFEDYVPVPRVDLICSFNSWHWVDPLLGVDKACEMLRPGGRLALVWTDVVQFGEPPFDERLEDLFGGPTPNAFDQVTACVNSVTDDHRFRQREIYRHPFSRRLDAEAFVNVRNTYIRQPNPDTDAEIAALIDREFGGLVTKIEEAVTFIFEAR
jgi:SAM-dependent methyltransferase